MLRERFQTFLFLVVLVFSLQLITSEKTPTEEEPVVAESEKEPVVSDETTGEPAVSESEKPVTSDESSKEPAESESEKEAVESESGKEQIEPDESEKEPAVFDPEEEEPPQCSQTSQTQTSTDDDDNDDNDDDDEPPQEEPPCIPPLEEEPTDEADDAEQSPLSSDTTEDDVDDTFALLAYPRDSLRSMATFRPEPRPTLSPTVRPRSTPTDCPADIIFVLDGSGSIGTTNFNLMKSFLSQLVDRLDIDRGNTRVGVVTFSSGVRSRFNLGTHSSVAAVKAAISSITFSNGGTNTAAALAHVRTSMLTSSAGDRSNVPNVVVVLTDGRSNNAAATRVEAGKLKGITVGGTPTKVVALGIGSSVSQTELNNIASAPQNRNVIRVQNFATLTDVAEQLRDTSCSDSPDRSTCVRANCTNDICRDNGLECCGSCTELNRYAPISLQVCPCCPQGYLCCASSLPSRNGRVCCPPGSNCTTRGECVGQQSIVRPTSSERAVQQCEPMKLAITVDNIATKLYVDGVLTPLPNYSNWRIVDTITIPADTGVIAVQGRDHGVIAGMLASIGDDYFLTNSRSWKCTVTYSTNWMQPTFNDAAWPAAVFVKPNSQSNRFHSLRPEISARATWIWTRNFYWPIDPVVYCRGRLPTNICNKDYGNCTNPCAAANKECCHCEMSRVGPTKACSCCPRGSTCCPFRRGSSTVQGCCPAGFTCSSDGSCRGSSRPNPPQLQRGSCRKSLSQPSYCSRVVYDRRRSMCCNGVVRYRTYGMFSGCCGSVIYRYTTHSCCSNRVYNRNSYVCCGGQLMRKSYGSNTRCCGRYTYNYQTQVCCRGVVRRKSYSSYTRCCNTATYNYRSSICCSGLVRRRTYGWSSSCCGSTVYNYRTHRCINGRVVPRTSGRTCGTTVYNYQTQLCCSGRVVSKTYGSNSRCCGTSVYNYQTHSCCSRRVVRKTYGSRSRCCGASVYDYQSQLCCSGRAVRKTYGSSSRCCGTAVYNYQTHRCSYGRVVSKPGYRPCGTGVYNYQTQLCCVGRVVFKTYGSSSVCCGRRVCCDDRVGGRYPDARTRRLVCAGVALP